LNKSTKCSTFDQTNKIYKSILVFIKLDEDEDDNDHDNVLMKIFTNLKNQIDEVPKVYHPYKIL